MPYNPCGALVDWGRGGHVTKCRFFRDSDAECDIVWYPCHPDAPDLPFESGIVNSEWDVGNRRDGFPFRDGIGEVWDAPRFYPKILPIPAATGRHICGTADEHRNGAVFDPARPPVLYRADGLPTCCAPGQGVLIGSARSRLAGGVLIGSARSRPAQSVLIGSARSHPAGGVYVSAVASRAFTGCNAYHITSPSVFDTPLGRTPPGALKWEGFAIVHWRLTATDNGDGTGTFLLTKIEGGQTWAPSAPWDGQGSLVFHPAGGGAVGNVTVACLVP